MNALRIYFDRIDMIAERFRDVTDRRFDSFGLDHKASGRFAMEVMLDDLQRCARPHPINDFIQCELVVGVAR